MFLLGVAGALLGVNLWAMHRSGARPSDLDRAALSLRPIDLNRAGRAELMQLPGIGPSLAGRIDEHRQAHGPFQKVDDLLKVSGIGPATLRRIEPWVWISTAEEDGDLPPPVPAARLAGKKELALTQPIDINQATADELQKLPGIGPVLARRILDERAKAPFQSVTDLDRVPGIGPKILEKLRPHVLVRPRAGTVAAAE